MQKVSLSYIGAIGSRALRLIVEQLRRSWLILMGVCHRTLFILDTKPVPVFNVKRSNRHSDFVGSVSYGHTVSRNMKYFGYKLVSITTWDGIPVVYELLPAHTDEQVAAETVLYYLNGCDILGDTSFVGHRWQAKVIDY